MRILQLFILLILLPPALIFSQEDKKTEDAPVVRLFDSEEPLKMRFEYSIRDLKKETNDSTYILTLVSYQSEGGQWQELEGKIRVRGNFRLETCNFPPVKLKFKKKAAEGTIFQRNRSLKLVVPCLKQYDMNDNVLKELMAYKIYEEVSPYYLKTRQLDIDFTEIKGNKTKEYQLTGFFIEDIDKMAERHDGKEINRSIHPMEQDNVCSVRNDFFQYMIGNTDFSVTYRHNEKLIYTGNLIIPVPYDFDMSGLVNASYSLVSEVGNKTLPITDVTQRWYRGFKRTGDCYETVRKEYLESKAAVMQIVDSYKEEFENPKEFFEARKFLMEFFDVLSDDDAFKKNILTAAREK